MHDTLCNNHNDIIFDIDSLMKYSKKTNKDVFIINTLQNMKNKIKHCKKQGQRMENRLKKYRTTIETLGFKRIGGRETI